MTSPRGPAVPVSFVSRSQATPPELASPPPLPPQAAVAPPMPDALGVLCAPAGRGRLLRVTLVFPRWGRRLGGGRRGSEVAAPSLRLPAHRGGCREGGPIPGGTGHWCTRRGAPGRRPRAGAVSAVDRDSSTHAGQGGAGTAAGRWRVPWGRRLHSAPDVLGREAGCACACVHARVHGYVCARACLCARVCVRVCARQKPP